MFEVNIYIETEVKGPARRRGWYASVLEFLKGGKAITREDYVLEEETTYHRSVLRALLNSLKRLNTNCYVNIYTDSDYLKNSIENFLPQWKNTGFVNAKGKPLENQKEWMEVAKLIAGQKIKFRKTVRHCYTVVMQREAKRRFVDNEVENVEKP